MNKNMRFILAMLVIGAFVLVAAQIFAKKYEGFAPTCENNPKPADEAHASSYCPPGTACSCYSNGGTKCVCCDKKQ